MVDDPNRRVKEIRAWQPDIHKAIHANDRSCSNRGGSDSGSGSGSGSGSESGSGSGRTGQGEKCNTSDTDPRDDDVLNDVITVELWGEWYDTEIVGGMSV